jgi:hypothetical protein
MSLITKAPPAASIVINTPTIHLFQAAGGTSPCLLAIPASSGMEMKLLNVSATGKVQPRQAGTLEVGLFAYVTKPNQGPPDNTIANYVLIGQAPPEPAGGAGDLVETSWMVQGANLMYSLISGKMQGSFQSNVADHPVASADISTNPVGIRADVSPVMYFAVGARFTPTLDDGSTPLLTMVNFNLTCDW